MTCWSLSLTALLLWVHFACVAGLENLITLQGKNRGGDREARAAAGKRTPWSAHHTCSHISCRRNLPLLLFVYFYILFARLALLFNHCLKVYDSTTRFNKIEYRRHFFFIKIDLTNFYSRNTQKKKKLLLKQQKQRVGPQNVAFLKNIILGKSASPSVWPWQFFCFDCTPRLSMPMPLLGLSGL